MGIVSYEEISYLIGLRQEGGYWDFKREWHVDKYSLLHDIICMANNLVGRDAYIIIGVAEDLDYSILDVSKDTNRRNTQNLVDFLRDKHFAGGIHPTVSVETLLFDTLEVDVLVVHFDRNTPYYLSEKYGGVNANNIYTRVQDSNTPKTKSADINHIELLWKRRFCIDASINERFLSLLDKYEEWDLGIESLRVTFHKIFPEFKLEVDSDSEREGWEPQSPFYLDPKMYFAPMKLLYHDTVIFETGLISVDGSRVHMPYSEEDTFECGNRTDFEFGTVHFYYYDFAKFSGKLFRLITNGTLNYNGRSGHTINLYLLFDNYKERVQFKEFAVKACQKIDLSLIKEEFSHYLNTQYNGCNMQARILPIIVASKIYDMWKNSDHNKSP